MATSTDRNTGPTEAGLLEDLSEPCAAQEKQAQAEIASKPGQGTPRLLQANRAQVESRASDLESLLVQDHRARLSLAYDAY
jgi:hypothetical protein